MPVTSNSAIVGPTQEELDQGLYAAIYAGREKQPRLVKTLLTQGADPNYPDLLHRAAERGFIQTIRLLLTFGGDPDLPQSESNKSGPISNAAWYGKADVAREFLRAGADLYTNTGWLGHQDKARHMAWGRHADTDRLFKEWSRLPGVDEATIAGLDKAALFEPNAHGLCLADNPRLWRFAEQVFARLDEKGESLSGEEMLQPGQWDGGRSIFTHLSACRNLDAGLDYLKAKGERVSAVRLAEADSLLDVICEAGQVGKLFNRDLWHNAEPTDIRRLFDRLPGDAKEDVTNLHALIAECRSTQSQQGVSR